MIGVDHVTITTPEELEQETVDWYASCLGLDRVVKPEGTRPRGAWFETGAVQVHVTIDPHNPPKVAHFAVRVDDFEGAIEELRSAGCHLEQAAVIPGRRRCFTFDPAGNRIEIIGDEEKSS